MYTHFFGLLREPFSISPDPRYLFMSPRHHEALAHLLYGAAAGGGVVVLSGEIGTGKTTLCRCFLEQIPADCEVAYIFNPKLSVSELLQAICEEFGIATAPADSSNGVKDQVDALNRHLLAAHAEGRRSVLIIDEAQNLSIDVLEQLRLLTNLETSERKLLQIILIGQPELRGMLARPELEQLAQRVIARYHLRALSPQETASYIQHRLASAGLSAASPFQPQLIRRIHQISGGVPRRINLLCDRALLGAYSRNLTVVDRETLERAARELFDTPAPANGSRKAVAAALVLGLAATAAGFAWHDQLNVIAQQAIDRLAGAGAPSAAIAAVDATPTNEHKPEPPALPAPPTPAEPPAETEPVEPADLQPHPDTPILALDGNKPATVLDSSAQALQQLAPNWGVAASAATSCEALQPAGLRCYAGKGGLDELRQLDRPAILTLNAGDGRNYYAILDRLQDTEARLRVGNATETVSLVMLSRYFSGDFSTLWRLPPEYGEVVRKGDEGTEVDWIAAQLAKARHAAAPDGPQRFDDTMLERVREFQRVQGLKVDGVIGPATFMLLNRVAGIPEPRLRTAAPADASADATADGV
jgi:general secretion pathway protein A